jgi:hypothetical protein
MTGIARPRQHLTHQRAGSHQRALPTARRTIGIPRFPTCSIRRSWHFGRITRRRRPDCRNKFATHLTFRCMAWQGRLSCFGFVEDSSSVQVFPGPASADVGRVHASAPDEDGAFRFWRGELMVRCFLIGTGVCVHGAALVRA